MMQFLTSPYILLPICLVLWLILKKYYDDLNQAKWKLYQDYVKANAIVSRDVMTPNEKEFFARLKGALPEYEVIPQVAMSALLDVSLPEMHPDYWKMRKEFSQKTVDYVVCTKGSMNVVVVVELDDRTHDTKQDKDAARDAMLANAGIKTIRWDSRAKPSADEIRAKVSSVAART
jgi:hypothetical protein